MNAKAKIAAAGLIALLVLGTGFAFAKEPKPGGGGGETRDPWTKPLPLPDDERVKALRVAVCTAWRGGVKDDDMLAHVLAQVWPDVPWASVLAIPAEDHESVEVAIKAAWAEIETFRAQSSEEARQQWCESGGPVPKSTYEQRKQALDALSSEMPRRGKFSQILSQGWKGGISQFAGRVLEAEGLNTKTLRAAYMREISRSQWNRKIYGRNARADDPGYAVADGMIISPAWNPRHHDARESILSLGRVPPRNIYNDGAKMGPGASFGMPFAPDFDVDKARNDGVLVITKYEPDELVVLLEE